MTKFLLYGYLTYCHIRRKIRNLTNSIFLYCYTTILTPWAVAISISIWNKYLNSQYFKIRKETMGEKFAKEWFFNDPSFMHKEHRDNVFKDKKLMWRIIFLPFTIQPEKYPHNSRILTASDLW